jgi:hypothetical protein
VQVYWENPDGISPTDGIIPLSSTPLTGGRPGLVSGIRDVTPSGPAPTGLAIVNNATGISGALTNARLQLTSSAVQLRWTLAAHNTTNLNDDVNAFLITKMIGTTPIGDPIMISRASANMSPNTYTYTDHDLDPGVEVRYQVQSCGGQTSTARQAAAGPG